MIWLHSFHVPTSLSVSLLNCFGFSADWQHALGCPEYEECSHSRFYVDLLFKTTLKPLFFILALVLQKLHEGLQLITRQHVFSSGAETSDFMV